MLEKGAERMLRLVDNTESSKVSVAIVDPGWIELSLRRETVRDPPSLGLSARTKRSTAVKIYPDDPVKNELPSGPWSEVEALAVPPELTSMLLYRYVALAAVEQKGAIANIAQASRLFKVSTIDSTA
jgi:hypothetical protein